MRGPIANLMQQAQRMQDNLKQAQEALAKLEVTGQAGGGMVSVTMTGRMEVRSVRIDRSMLGDDPEMLEDLLAAAINDAVNKANTLSQERMGDATAGLSLPPGMKIPGLF
jgi:DNA-binding YbaB/EbfC family protein